MTSLLSPLDPHIASVLSSVFAKAEDAVGISHQNVILLVNPAMLRLFGRDHPSELCGRLFLDLVAPESRAALLEHIGRRTRGEPVTGLYTAKMIRADGVVFTAEIRTTTFHHGGEPFALALLRDVATYHHTADELYEAIFSKNTAVKLLIDPENGQLIDVNQAAAEFYGWSIAKLRTMRISEINTLPPEQISAQLAAARSGQRKRFRFQHRIASGEIRSVDIHTGMIALGGRSLLLSIVQDTTERERLEEQLQQSQKLEAIGRLAGTVAHDFNNLLTVVMSRAELLRHELPDEGPARRHLDDLLRAAERAGSLTHQLLAVGQRQQLLPKTINLEKIVIEIEGLLAHAAGPDVSLEFNLADNLTVELDPLQFEQVMMNLVLNAREATANRVIITGRVDGVVEIAVEDNGCGMNELTKSRIFEPFYTTKIVGEGKGLGLASVWGIVTQSGGTITVDSEPGWGTRFVILFPCQPVAPSSAANT